MLAQCCGNLNASSMNCDDCATALVCTVVDVVVYDSNSSEQQPVRK
jgi:hypothetical protein